MLNVTLVTADEKTVPVKAVFDTGSFYTIVREDVLPEVTPVITAIPIHLRNHYVTVT